MSTRGRKAVYRKETGSLPVGDRVCLQRMTDDVYLRQTESLPKGDRLSTRGGQSVSIAGRKAIYRKETGSLPVGDSGCIPDGDRVSTGVRKRVFTRGRQREST